MAIVVPDVTAALAALATAVLGRLPGVTVAGITGSSGKTSTKDLVAQLAERLGPTVAPEGSFNNELGLPLTVLRAGEQTKYLVLEMSARGPGHIAALCEVAPPRIGAVLNVGRAHAGSYRAVARTTVAKAKPRRTPRGAARRRRGHTQRRRPPGARDGGEDVRSDRHLQHGPGRGRAREGRRHQGLDDHGQRPRSGC